MASMYVGELSIVGESLTEENAAVWEVQVEPEEPDGLKMIDYSLTKYILIF